MKVPVSLIIDMITFSANRFLELLLKISLVLATACKNEKELSLT
jgi:hypothetical protein